MLFQELLDGGLIKVELHKKPIIYKIYLVLLLDDDNALLQIVHDKFELIFLLKFLAEVNEGVGIVPQNHVVLKVQ